MKKRQKEIDFVTTNREIFRFIINVLRSFEINFSTLVRKRNSLNLEIYIYGKDDADKFISAIGFLHPVKLRACLTR